MNSLAIVNELYRYFSLLTAIETLEKKNGYANKPGYFHKSVSLRYDFITLVLKFNDEENLHSECFNATFKLVGHTPTLTELHCIPDERKNEIRDYVRKNSPQSFNNEMLTNSEWVNETVIQYLNIADEIAKQAFRCSQGDDYRPGYFSEVVVDDSGIILRQINRWNSRSILHKNDYYLRDLEFHIPTADVERKLSYGAEKIGRMTVFFSDSSSVNNKSCGDRIYNAIQAQKSQFETSQ